MYKNTTLRQKLKFDLKFLKKQFYINIINYYNIVYKQIER